MIFNAECIHQHCLTGISKLKTYDESARGMSTDNKRQLIIFYVTCLPIENEPRELATCLRAFLDNCGTMHAELYGKPAPSSTPWPELHMPLHNKIFAINICQIRSSVCWDTLFPKQKQDVPQDQCHIKRISMTVYFSFNVYQSSHDTFYCVSDFQYKTLTCYFIRMLTSQLIFDLIWHNTMYAVVLVLFVCFAVNYK